jgi:pimeloyl-ACP methyl ester carboxylesterase
MTHTEPQTILVGEDAAARRIAWRRDDGVSGAKPGVFWLSGFKSDMASTKAAALAQFAQREGLSCTRFDYSGHGVSGGRFEDGTIGRWLEEAVAVFTRVSRGPQVVVGSSMGGHIALLLLRHLIRHDQAQAARLRGMVLIAPAWDMTEELMWKEFDAAARAELEGRGYYLEPSDYGEPYLITRALIEDGRRHLIGNDPFDPERPVHIIQGLQDKDVPAAHARRLIDLLPGGRVRYSEVPDGEHRLSRPQDLELLFAVLRQMIAEVSVEA